MHNNKSMRKDIIRLKSMKLKDREILAYLVLKDCAENKISIDDLKRILGNKAIDIIKYICSVGIVKCSVHNNNLIIEGFDVAKNNITKNTNINKFSGRFTEIALK